MNTYLLIGFCVSLICSILQGYDFAFNTYALALKETFNLTQAQVEITASFGSFGYIVGSVQPILRHKLGLPLILISGWLLSSGSLAIFSLLSYYNIFTKNYPVIIYVVQFLSCSGYITSHICISGICLENIPKQHSAKVVGLYAGLFSFAKIFYGGLYELFFVEDLAGFFLAASCLAFVVIGIASFFVNIVDSKKSTTDEYEQFEDLDQNKTIHSIDKLKADNILLSLDFHRLFWPACLSMAMTTALANNITSVAQSIRLSNPMVTVYVLSVSIATLRIVSGIIFDKAASELIGFMLLFFGYGSFLVSLGLGLLVLNEMTVIIMACLLGVCHGINVTVTVGILLCKFGRIRYVTIFSLNAVVGGITCIIFQLTTGFIYDQEIPSTSSTNVCYGPECFYWQFFMFLILTVILLLWQIMDLVLKTNRKCAQDEISDR